MGKLIDETSYAIKKTTKSILVLPADSIVIEHKVRSIGNAVKRAQAICLSCRMCTDLCPRYLLGHNLFPDEMMKKCTPDSSATVTLRSLILLIFAATAAYASFTVAL